MRRPGTGGNIADPMRVLLLSVSLLALPALADAQSSRGKVGRDRPMGNIGRRELPELGTDRPLGSVGSERAGRSVGSGRPFGSVGSDRPFGGSDELRDRTRGSLDSDDRADDPRSDRRRNRFGRVFVDAWWLNETEARWDLGPPPPPVSGEVDSWIWPEPRFRPGPVPIGPPPVLPPPVGSPIEEVVASAERALDAHRAEHALALLAPVIGSTGEVGSPDLAERPSDSVAESDHRARADGLWLAALLADGQFARAAEWVEATFARSPQPRRLGLRLASRERAIERLEFGLGESGADPDRWFLHTVLRWTEAEIDEGHLSFQRLRLHEPNSDRVRWLERAAPTWWRSGGR